MTTVAASPAGVHLDLNNAAAFHAVWTALNQFVDNQREVENEDEYSAEECAQVAAARDLIAGMDRIVAANLEPRA